MGALTLEGKLGGNKRILSQTVDRAEFLADMIVECDIDIGEIAVTDKIGAADELFLRRSAKNLECSCEPELIHRLFHGERCADHDGGIDVVSFAVARGSFDDGFWFGDSRRLRGSRCRVEFGVKRDNRLA